MSVTWSGLQEFKNELRKLPDELKGEGAKIVLDTAQSVARDVQAAYPQGPTGNLKRGVRMTVEALDRGGSAARVQSTARHAHLFEKGTGPRQNRRGANRGRMPAAPESQQMIPIAIRARRQMYERLIRMVQAHGLTVTAS